MISIITLLIHILESRFSFRSSMKNTSRMPQGEGTGHIDSIICSKTSTSRRGGGGYNSDVLEQVLRCSS
jgi:hypothetical protein